MGANKHDSLQASEEDLFQGLDIIAGEPIYTTDAHVIFSNQEGTQQKEDTTFQSEQSVKATKSFRIKSIIAISLGLFIVGVVALFLTHEHSPFYIGPTSSNNVSQQPVSSSQDNTTQDKSISKTILNNDEIFTTLTEAYDRLAHYLDELSICVDEFNGSYTLKDKAIRTQAKTHAQSLQSSIHDELKALDEIDVPMQNMYFNNLVQIQGMYQAFDGRITPLMRAWDESLKYDNPTAHSTEILAELSRDYVAGNNPNIELFDAMYYGHKPQKLHE